MSGAWKVTGPIAGHRLILLITIVLVILPHVSHLPAWLSITCLGVILWRLFAELTGRVTVNKWFKLVLTLAGCVAIFADFQTFFGRQAGSALLIMMLCFKLFELQRSRDIFQVIYISYFIVAVGFLFSQSIWMGLYMSLVILMITVSLIAYSHLTAARQPLRFDYLKVYTNRTMRILVQGVPLALIMFLLFPRLPGPLWELPHDAISGRTGLSDNMSPGNISDLTSSEEVAFRVTFKGEIPNTKNMYWRGPVFAYFDGKSWSDLGITNIRRHQIVFTAVGKRTDYIVTLEPHERKWLFALDLPASIPLQSYVTPEYQLMAKEPVQQIKRYQLSSYLDYQMDEDSSPSRIYTVNPRNFAPRAQALARQWQAESSTPREIINRALAYYRDKGFYYTRQPPLMQNDPVDQFLFGAKRGYCEHFASSFAVLMRAAGIPARIVTGYQGGEINPLGNYLIVRQSRAHAWTEVWLENRGWVRVDPTAVIPKSRIEADVDVMRIQPLSLRARRALEIDWLTTSYKRISYLWDSLNNRWNQWVVGFNQSRQLQFLAAIGLSAMDSYWLGASLIGLVMLGVALIGLGVFRKPRARLTPPVRYYEKFCRKLGKKGLPKAANEGAMNFAQRVIARYPDSQLEVMQITNDYYTLRYARTGDEAVLNRLKSGVRVFKV